METVKKEYAKKQREIETAKALSNSIANICNSNSPASKWLH